MFLIQNWRHLTSDAEFVNEQKMTAFPLLINQFDSMNKKNEQTKLDYLTPHNFKLNKISNFFFS